MFGGFEMSVLDRLRSHLTSHLERDKSMTFAFSIIHSRTFFFLLLLFFCHHYGIRTPPPLVQHRLQVFPPLFMNQILYAPCRASSSHTQCLASGNIINPTQTLKRKENLIEFSYSSSCNHLYNVDSMSTRYSGFWEHDIQNK